MSDILIRCPVAGVAVPTGLSANTSSLGHCQTWRFNCGALDVKKCIGGNRKMLG
jgi:hypothetical protein